MARSREADAQVIRTILKESRDTMLSYLFSNERPQQDVPFVPSTANQEEKDLSLKAKRAVIVEDEGLTQLQLKRMLRSEGIAVVGAAANGQEGVEVVLRERPDLVLMDINLPLLNGLQAAEQILAQYPVCIVMLTAYSDQEYMQQAQQIGTCGYVLKPVTVETLMPRLKAAYVQFHRASA